MIARLTRSSLGLRAGVLGLGLALCTAGTAQADEALEARIQQLEAQLDELRSASVAGSASTDLDARVSELEKLTKKDKGGLFPYWKTGLRMDSADKKFKLKIGGRIMNDYQFWASERATEAIVGDQLTTGTEFRRARFFMSGDVYNNVGYKLQVDLADGTTSMKDAWISLKTGCIGKLKVGHQKEPFSLEELTSSKYIAFTERSLPNAFAPGRNTGVSLSDSIDDQFFWAVGVFRDAADDGEDTGNMGEGEWNFTGRIAGKVWEDEDSGSLLHLGVSASHRNFSDETVRFRARPEVHLGPRFVDTGALTGAHDGNLFGLEAAFISGSFWAMGEYMTAEADITGGSDLDVDGYTLQAGYFLTGESRSYKGGTFSRNKPKNDLGSEDGSGAVELTARVSNIDLNDGLIRGGELDNFTVGLNYYLNPNTRVMLNWVMIDLDVAGAKDVDAVVARFQIDF